MKKFMSIVLSAVMVMSCIFALTGCSKEVPEKIDIVYLTNGATVSDSGYNQSAWGGIKDFAEENKMTYKYYQLPLQEDELTAETIANYIEIAVNDGAQYIVLPGEDFAVSAYEVAPTYKDVNFVLVDALPHSLGDSSLRMQQNVMCISFDALQAGFLAGYSTVLDGKTKLGYIGSVDSKSSGDYGAGYVQGAALAADQFSKPVKLDYADYDSAILSYDYSFTIEPEYVEIPSDDGVEYFNVKVENGYGTGTYAEGENVTIQAKEPEEGKKFDHWEVKSNTDGVKDSKVNISSKKDFSMNLIAEKCDCTITAVYSDIDTATITVKTNLEDVEAVCYKPVNEKAWIEAPVASVGTVFDHWEAEEGIVEDVNSKGTNVNVGDKDITLNAVYVPADVPTFNIQVKNGTGSGSYITGDHVQLIAEAPKDGFMFKKWTNVDAQGVASGVSMENEYSYMTSFDMVDRFASMAKAMYNDGTQVIFAGGNKMEGSVFEATKAYDHPVYAFGYGIDEGKNGNCLASVVNDYGAAIKLALNDYKGGTILKADCSNDCIYVTGKSLNADDESYNEDYAKVYTALAQNGIQLVNVQSGGDVRKAFVSNCLSLNYWIVDKENK